MKELTLRLSVTVLLAFFITAFTTGCNTIEGAGEDIESAGEAIEESAD